MAAAGWCAIGLMFWLIAQLFGGDDGHVRWTAVDVTDRSRSGDAHILELPGGEVWMVDGGNKDLWQRSGAPLLKDRGIDRIDGFILTHGHRNHFEGGVPVVAPRPGEVVFDDDDVRLKILHQFNENPFFKTTGATDFTVNNVSIVTLLEAGEVSVLFPGAIVATMPAPLWPTPRAALVRNFAADRSLPVYVSGLHGNVEFNIDGESYTVTVEKSPETNDPARVVP